MVAPDAGDVALGLLRPVVGVGRRDAGTLVLQVARPHYLQRLRAVEREAPGGLDVEPRVGVVDRLGEVHLDTAEGVHHVDEAVEVEFDEVLDRDAVVLFDRRDQLIGPLIQRGVDLVGTVRAGVRHEEVAREGEDREGARRRVEVQDHDDVAVDAVHPLGAESVGGVLHLEGAARRRTDHEDVLRAGIAALEGGRRQVLEVDPVDLVVEVPGVAGGGTRDEDDHQRHGPADPGHRPSPRPLLRRRVGGAIASSSSGSDPGAPTRPARPVRLVDLGAQPVQPALDRVLRRTRWAGCFGCPGRVGRVGVVGRDAVVGRDSLVGGAGVVGRDGVVGIECVGTRAGSRLFDLASERVEAPLDGVVLGIGRAHAQCVVECGRWVPGRRSRPRVGSGSGGRNG